MNEQWFPLEIGLSAALGCHMSLQTTHTRASAGKPELERLVWMERRKGIGRRELDAASPGGWSLGSKGSTLPVTESWDSTVFHIWREWGTTEEKWLGQGHTASCGKAWAGTQFFWLEAQSSFFSIKWWTQFSRFLGPRIWTFSSWSTLSTTGLRDSKSENECGNTQHSGSFHFHLVGPGANLLSIWVSAQPLTSHMTLGKSLNLSKF